MVAVTSEETTEALITLSVRTTGPETEGQAAAVSRRGPMYRPLAVGLARIIRGRMFVTRPVGRATTASEGYGAKAQEPSSSFHTRSPLGVGSAGERSKAGCRGLRNGRRRPAVIDGGSTFVTRIEEEGRTAFKGSIRVGSPCRTRSMATGGSVAVATSGRDLGTPGGHPSTPPCSSTAGCPRTIFSLQVSGVQGVRSTSTISPVHARDGRSCRHELIEPRASGPHRRRLDGVRRSTSSVRTRAVEIPPATTVSTSISIGAGARNPGDRRSTPAEAAGEVLRVTRHGTVGSVPAREARGTLLARGRLAIGTEPSFTANAV